MNPRERFLTALRGGMPDRAPLFETHFCLRFIREVLGADVSPYHNVDDENAIMDDIVQMKISGFNPVQRNAAMDIAALKRTYGNRLCFIGNISASQTLPYGSPEDVKLQCLECLRDVAPGGAYIMAPDHSYHYSLLGLWRRFLGQHLARLRDLPALWSLSPGPGRHQGAHRRVAGRGRQQPGVDLRLRHGPGDR